MIQRLSIQNRQDVLGLREDLSPYLVHLTRNGPLKVIAHDEATCGTSNGAERWCELNAKQNLISILNSKMLEARSPFSYFNFKVPMQRANGSVANPNSFVKRQWLHSVCFTETPLSQILVQCQPIPGRKLHFQPYGLAFKEKAVRKCGGNPVFYFESSSGIRSSLDELAVSPNCEKWKATLPLFEAFGKPLFSKNGVSEIDFRWEREWRIVGNFSFAFEDVAYGLCPKDEAAEFEALCGGQITFVDPGILSKK
jgi:hypothetical protein